MNAAPRLRLELRASPVLALLILGAHGAAAACAAAVLPALPGTLMAAAFIALGLAVAWRVALLRGPGAVRAIEIGSSGVVLERAGGERLPVPVAGRRYVHRRLVVLPMAGRPGRAVLVTAGMLDARAFRRLRLWALWRKLSPVAGTQLPVHA